MRHPFDGLILESENQSSNEVPADPTSRRVVLKTAVAGYATLVGLSAQGDDRIEPDLGTRADHGRYLVIPKDFRSFKTGEREKIGVQGSYFRSKAGKKGEKMKAGFLAWLTADDAVKLAGHEAVKSVHEIASDDVPGPGKRPKGAKQVVVLLAPNGWKNVAAGTYVPTDELVAAWGKRLGELGKIKVTRSKPEGQILLNLDGELSEAAIAELKSHPQVVGLSWQGVLTTQALGEEGATTKALGEEGGPRPTTLALGEEGGGVTTQALGEEGGPRPSTRRLGEEGGKPIKPPVRPPQQATTLALGEEGAGK